MSTITPTNTLCESDTILTFLHLVVPPDYVISFFVNVQIIYFSQKLLTKTTCFLVTESECAGRDSGIVSLKCMSADQRILFVGLSIM